MGSHLLLVGRKIGKSPAGHGEPGKNAGILSVRKSRNAEFQPQNPGNSPSLRSIPVGILEPKTPGTSNKNREMIPEVFPTHPILSSGRNSGNPGWERAELQGIPAEGERGFQGNQEKLDQQRDSKDFPGSLDHPGIWECQEWDGKSTDPTQSIPEFWDPGHSGSMPRDFYGIWRWKRGGRPCLEPWNSQDPEIPSQGELGMFPGKDPRNFSKEKKDFGRAGIWAPWNSQGKSRNLGAFCSSKSQISRAGGQQKIRRIWNLVQKTGKILGISRRIPQEFQKKIPKEIPQEFQRKNPSRIPRESLKKPPGIPKENSKGKIPQEILQEFQKKRKLQEFPRNPKGNFQRKIPQESFKNSKGKNPVGILKGKISQKKQESQRKIPKEYPRIPQENSKGKIP